MKRKNIKWLLVVVWMIVIFVFSSMNGDSSDEKSKFVIYIFNLLGLNLDGIFGTLADFIVRKCAHFTEYFILYMLLYNALRENFNFKKALLFSIIGVFLYASSDEFHQSFVPGRGPSFRDVCIDTSGGLLASVILYLNVTFKKTSAK
ncbi:VanZ-like protein [Clostridiales bacterium oral taxon 876 str. F0540]|nr:VanZ-like protein [Clostridiales bacterium oral taxon 876 str. F0540]